MKNMAKRNPYRSLRVILTGASLVLLISSWCPAAVTPVFECDFEGGPVPEISGAGAIVGTQGYSNHGLGNLFLQNATGGGPANGEPGEPTFLTLTNLPFHTHVKIRMDLAIINSWDGSNLTWGPDYFNVIVDDQSVFRETFSNIESFPQSFVPAADQVVVKCDVLFDDSE